MIAQWISLISTSENEYIDFAENILEAEDGNILTDMEGLIRLNQESRDLEKIREHFGVMPALDIEALGIQRAPEFQGLSVEILSVETEKEKIDDDLYTETEIQKHCLSKKRVMGAIHGSILSMGKYREGEIKEALDEFIDLLYKNLNLEDKDGS